MKKKLNKSSSKSFKWSSSKYKLFIKDYNKKRIQNASNSIKKYYHYNLNSEKKFINPLLKVKETLNFFNIKKKKKNNNIKNELNSNKLKFRTHLKLVENIKQNNIKNYKYNIKIKEDIINENKKRIKKIFSKKKKLNLTSIILKHFKINLNLLNYKINKININNDNFKPKNLIGNKLEYVYYDEKPHLLLYGGQIEKKYENIYLYNIKNNLWFDYSKNIYESSRFFHGIINYKQNKIIIYSGIKNLSDDKLNLIDNCKLLNLEKNKITNLKIKSIEFPNLRKNFAYCNHHNNLIIFGGLDNDSNILNDLWMGYIKNKSIFWMKFNFKEEVIDLSHGSIVSSYCNKTKNENFDFVYLFGGINIWNTCLNSLYKISITNQNVQWEMVKFKGKKPKPRYGNSLNYSAKLNCLIIFGGIDLNYKIFGDLFLFNWNSNMYFELKFNENDIPKKRYNHSLIIKNKTIFIFGGMDNYGLIDCNLNIYKIINKFK